MRRPGEREHDAVGDLVGGDRVDALVDGVGRLLVAAEADDGELRLDEPASTVVIRIGRPSRSSRSA